MEAVGGAAVSVDVRREEEDGGMLVCVGVRGWRDISPASST